MCQVKKIKFWTVHRVAVECPRPMPSSIFNYLSLGADTKKVFCFLIALCFTGLIQFFADYMTRHVVVVGGLQAKGYSDVFGDGSLSSFFSHREEDSDSAKTVAGVMEFDYIDYHLRQITFFFFVLFMQPLAARIAADEGNGRHQAVGKRLSAALTFAARASACVLVVVVGLQLLLRTDMVRARIDILSNNGNSGTISSNGKDLPTFASFKFCGGGDQGDTKSSLLCIWHHTVLRFVALPLHIVCKCAAIPCFLGVHRVDLVLIVSVVQAMSRMVFTWFAVMQLELRLTGAGIADLLSACVTISILIYIMSLESIRTKYHVKWNPKSMFNVKAIFNNAWTQEEMKFHQDIKITLPRAIVFVLIRIIAASLFDVGNPWSSWSLNTAFGALQQLEELPSVVGDSLSLIITVIACKYLNHIYMIYNPHDFEELVYRFPWITAGLTLIFASVSVHMAPFTLGPKLTASTGIGQWFGMLCYILSQVLSSAALMFEGLLFANVEFQTVTRMSVISFVPMTLCFTLVWMTGATTPFLWLALASGSATRLWLARRHVYRTTLGQLNEDGTTIDEFDALLNDEDDMDDEGPIDLEARGLVNGARAAAAEADKNKKNKKNKSRRPSTRRVKKEQHKRYENYKDMEKDDEEFQNAFRDGDGDGDGL